MTRLFIASRPYSISNVMPDDWYQSRIPNWYQATICEDPADCPVEPVLGFNPGSAVFEKPLAGIGYRVYLVDDEASDPLCALAITSEDYLIYHEATRNDAINALFGRLQKKAAKHEESRDTSDYALAFSFFCDGKGDKVERAVEAIFPYKREILCFLSQLNGEVFPAFPERLEALRDEYERLKEIPGSRESSPDQWYQFVDGCLEIYRSL